MNIEIFDDRVIPVPASQRAVEDSPLTSPMRGYTQVHNNAIVFAKAMAIAILA